MDLPEASEERMRKLADQLSPLRQRRECLNQKSRGLAEKRDKLHIQIKDLLLEIARNREQRDALNREVKELKTQRDESREQTRSIAEEIRKLNRKLTYLRARKPKKRSHVLKREKERIEWKIQTTSLSLEEEKPLVRRANELEIQLSMLHQISQLEAGVGELNCRINTKRRKAALFHAQLSELAQQSQELHRRMASNMERKKALQAEADRHHQHLLETRLAAQKVHEGCVEVREQIEILRKGLVEGQEKRRKLQQEEIRRRLKAKASEKLKQGEKLTFEEFKLLTEDG